MSSIFSPASFFTFPNPAHERPQRWTNAVSKSSMTNGAQGDAPVPAGVLGDYPQQVGAAHSAFLGLRHEGMHQMAAAIQQQMENPVGWAKRRVPNVPSTEVGHQLTSFAQPAPEIVIHQPAPRTPHEILNGYA